MAATIRSMAEARTRPMVDPIVFAVPARHNPRLQAVVERINHDDELRQLWRCGNLNVLNRPDLGDSGEVHVHIVANAALKLLRLIRDAGHPTAAVARHRLTPEEAEVIVVLAAAVHDLGLAVHTEPAQAAGANLVLADRKCRELLDGIYPLRERTIVVAECLHAVTSLEPGAGCGSLEASLVKLADALDLAKGRGRLAPSAFEAAGGANAAAGVEEVVIERSKSPPVRIVIRLSQLSGREAVEARLRHGLRGVHLAGVVEVVAELGDRPGAGRLPVTIWDNQG